MKGTWWEGIRDHVSAAWAVLMGRAYAAYSVPDVMDEVKLRIALCEIEEIADDRADVDDGTPNDWMRVLVLARTALGVQP